MEILYRVHSGLYVNLTNRCSAACTFCLRQTMDHVGQSHSLWLEREPTAQEVIEEFGKWDLSEFTEIVFCGFGEPTCALDVLLEVAAWLKAHTKLPIRVNTNGHGSLIAGRDIAPELKGLVDTVSVSLNHPDPAQYQALVRSRFGDAAFPGMLDFAKKCAAEGIRVVMTTVDTTISHEEEQQCRKICENLGATYRIRPWED
jgi:TatD family-associated radical SAM protein